MKIFLVGFSFFALVGGVMVYNMMHKKEDSRIEREFIQSRGMTEYPRSWRGKVGEGI